MGQDFIAGLLGGYNQGAQQSAQSAMQYQLMGAQKKRLDAQMKAQEANQAYQQQILKMLPGILGGDDPVALFGDEPSTQAPSPPPAPEPSRLQSALMPGLEPGAPSEATPARMPTMDVQGQAMSRESKRSTRKWEPSITFGDDGPRITLQGREAKYEFKEFLRDTPQGPRRIIAVIDPANAQSPVMKEIDAGPPPAPESIQRYQQMAAGMGLPMGTEANVRLAQQLGIADMLAPDARAQAISQLQAQVSQGGGGMNILGAEQAAQQRRVGEDLQKAEGRARIETSYAAPQAFASTTGRGRAEQQLPLSPTEAAGAGVPLGTTGVQAGGRYSLTPKQREEKASLDEAAGMLSRMAERVQKVNFAPPGGISRMSQWTEATWGAVTQTDPDAAALERLAGQLAIVARQMGEKGVLTDRDIERVTQMVPKKSDTAQIAVDKVNELHAFFTTREDAFKSSLTFQPNARETPKAKERSQKMQVNPQTKRPQVTEEALQPVGVNKESVSKIDLAETGYIKGEMSATQFLEVLTRELGEDMGKAYLADVNEQHKRPRKR